jgi:hypothetical protein
VCYNFIAQWAASLLLKTPAIDKNRLKQPTNQGKGEGTAIMGMESKWQRLPNCQEFGFVIKGILTLNVFFLSG